MTSWASAPPTSGLTPSLGPRGPRARDPRTQLHVPVGQHWHQDSASSTVGQAQAPGTPGPQPHSPVGQHQSQNYCGPTASHVKTQPTHQQARTTPGLLWPCSQMCQDPVPPTSGQQPPQKAGPGNQLDWGPAIPECAHSRQPTTT